MDQGINAVSELEESLNTLLSLSGSTQHPFHLKFITKDSEYEKVFNRLCNGQALYKAYYMSRTKIPLSQIVDTCTEEISTSSVSADDAFSHPNTGYFIGQKVKRIMPSNTAEDSITQEDYLMPKEIKSTDKNRSKSLLSPSTGNNASTLQKVIAITGDRGTGVTSTAANLGVIASNQGLSCVIVDLDIVRRGLNLYFNKFGEEAELRPELGRSLIKCLAKPDACDINTCRINDKLTVISLAYSAESSDKLLETVTAKKIAGLLCSLRIKYNMVILDLPMMFFKLYPELLMQIDTIGLCVNNNLYAIINTVLSIDDTFRKEDLMIFKMKSKAILSKFNEKNKHQGVYLGPELTQDILNSLSHDFELHSKHTGIIPYSPAFDLQIDSGRKICSTDMTYKRCFDGILSQLI
jgi:Mrp family chromosome partitioning ATPase